LKRREYQFNQLLNGRFLEDHSGIACGREHALGHGSAKQPYVNPPVFAIVRYQRRRGTAAPGQTRSLVVTFEFSPIGHKPTVKLANLLSLAYARIMVGKL